MKYIYMNEHISEKKPEDPVIAVFDDKSKRLVYSNKVDIKDRHGVIIARVMFGKAPKDLPHEAKAWVVVYDEYGYAKVDLF